MKLTGIFNILIALMVTVCLIAGGVWVYRWLEEVKVLRKAVERLSADSRIAEVMVTKSEFNEQTQKIETTIKFLEFDAHENALPPKYFTFQGNIIQFQSLVIRFSDDMIKGGDQLRGKSAYLFLKAFVLDGEKTQEFKITETYEVPEGYRVSENRSEFEDRLWKDFWKYAFDPQERSRTGIKNAQIEAPGSLFLPGTIYTLKIEHDGGIRIDARPVPEILKGEKL